MLAIASCAPPRTAEATLHPENAQDQARLREACNVTALVCTRCHDFARVTLVRFDRPERWSLLVSRMRYGLDQLAHPAPANANAKRGGNAASVPAPTHAPAPASSEPAPAPAAPSTPSSVPASKEIP
jgi:hypothetical protein